MIKLLLFVITVVRVSKLALKLLNIVFMTSGDVLICLELYRFCVLAIYSMK